MDEYTADPKETEREAQRILKQIETNKARAEVADIAKEERLRRVAENEYKKVPGLSRAGGSGGGGDFGLGIQKMNRDIKRTYKKGGSVSSASKRADGCIIKGKTRGKIV